MTEKRLQDFRVEKKQAWVLQQCKTGRKRLRGRLLREVGKSVDDYY